MLFAGIISHLAVYGVSGSDWWSLSELIGTRARGSRHMFTGCSLFEAITGRIMGRDCGFPLGFVRIVR